MFGFNQFLPYIPSYLPISFRSSDRYSEFQVTRSLCQNRISKAVLGLSGPFIGSLVWFGLDCEAYLIAEFRYVTKCFLMLFCGMEY